jgi:hypothetical protein
MEAVPRSFETFGDRRHTVKVITSQSDDFVEPKGAIGVYGGLNGSDGEPGAQKEPAVLKSWYAGLVLE